MMSETQLDGTDWKSINKLLPKGYVWRMQEATKEQVKGRGMGGMVSGVRKELAAEKKRDREGEEKEGSMVRRLKVGKENVAVVCVYR